MVKKCTVCGKEFTAKTDKAKYCCKKCANHSRFSRSMEDRRKEHDEAEIKAIELYDTDMSILEIARTIGKCDTFVHNAWKKAGLHRRLTTRQKQIQILRQQGLNCVEISEKLGISAKAVRQSVKQIGIPFTDEEKQRSFQLGQKKSKIAQWGTIKERTEHCREYVENKHPEFEYVSGWVASDGEVVIRCKACRNEVIKSAISLRGHKNTECPFCKEIKRKERLKQKQIEREKARIEAEKRKQEAQIQKFWEQPFKQATFSICPKCGSVFNGNTKYCSAECRQRAANAINKDKRLRKLKRRKIDDISLRELYFRDHGKCWLCGEKCDFDDYSRDQDDNFIVGKNYPSIDHVFPLSKGGMHSWDNVKLAHHYCNTLKNDKVVSL